MHRIARAFAGGFLIAVSVLSSASRPVAAQAAAPLPKPASQRTAAAPEALGAQQLADLAAKGLPVEAPPPPAPRLATPAQHAAFEAPLPSFTRRRLPGVSEAMGVLPREAWLRLAQRKAPDRAWIDGRSVAVPVTQVSR